MATMVDDKVLCHAFSDGETMVLLDQSQRKIDAGCDACRSPYVAVPTEDAICLNPDGWVLSLKARCISPVRRRSTPVQQSSRREGECTGADAHNAPASARCLNNTAQRARGYERIDLSAGDDERIEHGIIERHSSDSHAKAACHGTLISRKDLEPIGGTFEVVICRFEGAGRTGEVEHLKACGNVKTDRLHGRIIGKYDLAVK